MRNAAGGLQTLQREADNRIGQAAFDANANLQHLAQLNREIVAGERAGRETNDLRDQRQVALGELASQLSIQVVEGDSGSVNVYSSSGQGLVIGGDAATLTTELDPTHLGLDGNPLSRIGIETLDGGVILLVRRPSAVRSGRCSTLRDTTLTDNATSLDLLATTLRDAVNAVQTDPAGRDLDGNVGHPFFSGTGAADLRVAITDPRDIAAARATTNLADNTNALALVDVGTTDVRRPRRCDARSATSGRYSRRSANRRARAEDDATIEENVSAALAAQREAVSGVSLDEEFTNLIQFQRGFQAAAQLINVSNTMLDDLLGIVR